MAPKDRILTPSNSQLAQDFLDCLRELVEMRNTYKNMGGMTQAQAMHISQSIRDEGDRLFEQQKEASLTALADGVDFDALSDEEFNDFNNRELETVDALRKKMDAECQRKWEEAFIPPFCERTNLNAQPDDEMGMKPENFIKHNIIHYAMDFSDALKQDPSVRGVKTLMEKIATAHLNGKTPTETSQDITRLPAWIDKEVALLDAHPEVFRPEEETQKEAFRELLVRMKDKTLELLAIRAQVQNALQVQR